MSDGSFPTPISKDDNANSLSNPIFTQDIGEVVAGIRVANYHTSVLGNNATFNQDYTVVGTTFMLHRVSCSSTGQAKFEIQVGPVASLVSKGVVMVNPNSRTAEIVFDPPFPVPSTGTGTVRVIQKNLQGGSNDVYSTIFGEDLP